MARRAVPVAELGDGNVGKEPPAWGAGSFAAPSMIGRFPYPLPGITSTCRSPSDENSHSTALAVS
jgi:hypothetical protein